jgi:predicted NAD/FAD-binding protein
MVDNFAKDKKMNIAIVGGGISGLMAARKLHERQHSITVFEAQDQIGGHARTLRVPNGGGGTANIPIELGVFMHDPLYIHPTMNAYVREAGVISRPIGLCFSYASPGYKLAWSTRSKYSGALRDWHLLLSVAWDGVRHGQAVRNWEFMFEVRRFLRSLPDLCAGHRAGGMRLEDFVQKEQYSDCFVQTWLLPQILCWWGVTKAHALDTDIRVIADSMHDVVRAPQHFFPEGWDTFLKSIYSPFQERIQTGQRVLKINRFANHVQVVLNGHTEDFDQVIMAVPPSLALNLLADASAAEAALLQKFATISTTVFMHSDSSWLPAGMPWATINLMQDERGSFCTFWNGELHPGKPSVFITWGDGLKAVPDPAQTKTTLHWLRTLPTVSYSKASREMETIQGNGGVWHCGAHVHALDADSIPSLWHENAFRSGVRIAERISAQPGAAV